MKSPKLFLITWVFFSSAIVSISSKDVISRRQLWTAPKYTPSISSSYSNNDNSQNEVAAGEFQQQQQASGSSLAPNYSSYITSQVSSSTSEGGEESVVPEDDIANGSESKQVDTIEQYAITKEAESYPPPQPTNNNDYKQGSSNNNGSLQQQSYGGPDLTLQSRPVVYTPPHVTFHPPQIIISESGVVFTDPHTTYSHDLPTGPQENGQMIAYQPLQVQVASSSYSHLPQNVQVSYPQFPQQGSVIPQQQQQQQQQQVPISPYRQQQQVYPQQQQAQPQVAYNNNVNQYQGPSSPAVAPAPQGAQIPYQHYQQLPYPLQYPPAQQTHQQQQSQQEGTYPPQQQQQQQPMQMNNQKSNNGIGNRDGGRMRLKRGQPQKESSVPAAVGGGLTSNQRDTPNGRWPLSTITFQPVNN